MRGGYGTTLPGRTALLLGPALLSLWACEKGGGGESPPPYTLTAEGGTHPTVAVDPVEGTAYVAWVQLTGRGDDQDVHLVRIPAGGVPGEPVRVNTVAGDATPHEQAPAQVAVGPQGEVYVMWQKRTAIEGRRFGASTLRMARSLDGGATFEPAVEVADYRGAVPASHTFHNLVVDAEGRVIASWLDGRGAHEMEAAGVHGPDPGIDVRVAISEDGGTSFGASTVLAKGVCPCCRTALALGPDGAVYAAWRHIWPTDDGKEIRDLAVARSDDGGRSFGPPVRLHADNWVHDGCPHAGPALAVDGQGMLHALWYTGSPEGAGVFHTRSQDRGEHFGAATPLVQGEWVPPSRVALAASPGGALTAVWEDRRQDPPQFGLGEIPPGGAPATGGHRHQEGTFPMVAASPGGRVVAWLDGEAVHVRIEEER